MTEMFGEAWSPMSVPDLAPDDDDDNIMLSTGAKLLSFFDRRSKVQLNIVSTIQTS